MLIFLHFSKKNRNSQEIDLDLNNSACCILVLTKCFQGNKFFLFSGAFLRRELSYPLKVYKFALRAQLFKTNDVVS